MTPEVLETSRALAEGIASAVSDADKPATEQVAAEIAAGLRSLCETSTSREEVAVRMTHVIVRMLAELLKTPLQIVSDCADQNMTVYALAQGGLAGVFGLPGVEVTEPAPELAEVVQIGQYL